MNVYVCEFKGGYCGGLVVVAANSADESYRIVKNDNYLCLLYSCVDDIELEELGDSEFDDCDEDE